MVDDAVFLRHILESIALIEEYTEGTDLDAFLASTRLQDAVFRRLEIIGEAVKKLPQEYRDTHPDVPWKRVAGLRDVLIHQYFGVDAELTWELVQEALPGFKAQVQALVEGNG